MGTEYSHCGRLADQSYCYAPSILPYLPHSEPCAAVVQIALLWESALADGGLHCMVSIGSRQMAVGELVPVLHVRDKGCVTVRESSCCRMPADAPAYGVRNSTS